MVVFPILRGRSVGLAIVYGVAPNDAEIDQALQIATKVYAILKGLGQEGYFFQRKFWPNEWQHAAARKEFATGRMMAYTFHRQTNK